MIRRLRNPSSCGISLVGMRVVWVNLGMLTLFLSLLVDLEVGQLDGLTPDGDTAGTGEPGREYEGLEAEVERADRVQDLGLEAESGKDAASVAVRTELF